jgi:uncharacterized small protein (DUF1192 family)
MRICVVVVVLTILCGGCGTALTGTEKGAVAGYVIGSGAGAGIGAALGNPALGALAGGPAGAVIGILAARGVGVDQQIHVLQEELTRLDAELAVQREGLRRLAREKWLEP